MGFSGAGGQRADVFAGTVAQDGATGAREPVRCAVDEQHRRRVETQADGRGVTTMKVKAADLGAGFDPRNAEITVYHMWDESMVGVKSFDRATNTITFSARRSSGRGVRGK